MPKHDYTLEVGEKGAPRLELLNELCNPYSLNFIDASVNLANKNILEVGCGLGIMAVNLASRALPNGRVLATDISPEQIKLAQETARNANQTNIDFLTISAFDINNLDQHFDVIYFRFVLAHLEHVIEILQKLTSIMRPGGVLICDEPEEMDVMSCNPANELFTWWKKAVDVQMQSSKGNFRIGKMLYELFNQSSTEVKTNLAQPLMTTSRLKQQLWQGIVEIKPILIESHFATEEEIEAKIQALKIFANMSPSTIGFFSIRQVAATKEELEQALEARVHQL